MPIAPMPFIAVLNGLYTEVAAALAGFQLVTAPGATVNVRPFRHRIARQDEWYDVSIRYVANNVSNLGRENDDQGMPEEVWEVSVNLVIDGALPPEGSAPYAVDDAAPTGFEPHAEIIAKVLDRLFPDTTLYSENTLGGTTWMVRYDGTADNDDSDRTPDTVRMEERLTLFYRVRGNRPHILLGS